MRKKILEVADYINASKKLLDLAEIHLRNAAVESDADYAHALQNLGLLLTEYAKDLLVQRGVINRQAANDVPESVQESEEEEQPVTPPREKWFDWEEKSATGYTARVCYNSNERTANSPQPKEKEQPVTPPREKWFDWKERSATRYTAKNGNYTSVLRHIADGSWQLKICCNDKVKCRRVYYNSNERAAFLEACGEAERIMESLKKEE